MSTVNSDVVCTPATLETSLNVDCHRTSLARSSSEQARGSPKADHEVPYSTAAYRRGARLPLTGREPVLSLGRMASSTSDLRLSSQPQRVTAHRSVPNYTAW